MKTPMTSPEREFAENYERISTVFRRIRSDILNNTTETLGWLDVVRRCGNVRELQLLEQEVGHRWFRDFVYRELMPDKAGPRRSLKKTSPSAQKDLFPLDEVEIVDGKPLPRKRWNKEFMVELRQQKASNIRTAEHKLELFDFECAQIFPWFELHPNWLWMDAYNAIILRDGAFPDPPRV